jgi:diguanylate cyclase (GGDEF)-like protein
MIIIGFSISIIYIYTVKNVGKIYEQYARESIVDLKKSFLKDNVNNVISAIEQKKKVEEEYYKQLTQTSLKKIDEIYKSSPAQFSNLCIQYFNLRDNKDVFSILIYDKVSKRIEYQRDPSGSGKDMNYYQKVSLMKKNHSFFVQSSYGDYDVFFGVTEEYIDTLIKEQISDQIHNGKFSNNSYIWVNEVINYDGGDNYAIRRVHPNLIDTEGMWLSTTITDIKGNHPYLTELEGVKKDGEIFFKYYFKKNNSDVISEKLTYAKLYKEYNWIVAMGVHLDDVQAYVDITKTVRKQIILKMNIYIAFLILAIFILGLISLALLEKWYYKNTDKKLKQEAYMDPLTKVYNRRAAMYYMNIAFKNFKKTELSPAIIMIDIDDFKNVNDTYGHDEGDIVLKNTCEILNKHIRSADILCRWGGEELLLICNGLKVDDAISFASKLGSTVSEFEYVFKDKKYHVSVSMGISYFQGLDKDSNSSIKRADIQLYNSKNQGKNRVCM